MVMWFDVENFKPWDGLMRSKFCDNPKSSQLVAAKQDVWQRNMGKTEDRSSQCSPADSLSSVQLDEPQQAGPDSIPGVPATSLWKDP